MLTRQRILGGITAILSLSVLLAFLGVYNNSHMGFLLRIIFWASSISAGVLVGLLFLPILLTGYLSKQHLVIKVFLLSVVTAVPPLFVNAAFGGGRSLEGWLIQYLMSLVISLIMNVSVYTTMKAINAPNKQVDSLDEKNQTAQSTTIKFMERLPIKYRDAKLYAVSSEDHYVQVHTDRGTELILMRLSDALKELSDADGQQTHRSWWVAREGIIESVRKNGKYSLVLKSGVTAPISRSFSKILRNTKFID